MYKLYYFENMNSLILPNPFSTNEHFKAFMSYMFQKMENGRRESICLMIAKWKTQTLKLNNFTQ